MKDTNRKIIEFLKKSGDIDISDYSDQFLKKIIDSRMEKVASKTIDSYLEFLRFNPLETRKLTNSLEISYSTFFRNSLTFSVLEKIILPSLFFIQNQKHSREVRIWSAACAGGQEIYSLAILINEMKESNTNTNHYRIFASDKSESQIVNASKGIFSYSAVENVTISRIERWFKLLDETYIIESSLKKDIEFSVFNLLDPLHSCPPTCIFGEFEIVFLSNLLFYYKPLQRKIILEKARNVLSENGYLVTGESEREILLQHNFQEVYPNSCIFKSKKMK